jgi:hypothetical protein
VSDFSNYTYPIARKGYRCIWCGDLILKGEKHVHFSGMWEGEWQNWRMHVECYDEALDDDDIQDGFTPYDHERPERDISTQ